MKLQILKIKVSLSAAALIFKNPIYILLSVVSFFTISSLIIWALNLNLVAYIVFEAPLPIIEKVRFFTDVYVNMLIASPSLQNIGILLFSGLFGINIAALVYVMRNIEFSKVPKKSGFGGLLFAVLGGGCIACGVSILAPVLATFGATSVVFFEEISMMFNWIGVVLVSYSIYKLGGLAAYIKARDVQ